MEPVLSLRLVLLCCPITLLTPEIIVWLFRCAYWRIYETERCADLMMLLAGVGALPLVGGLIKVIGCHGRWCCVIVIGKSAV